MLTPYQNGIMEGGKKKPTVASKENLIYLIRYIPSQACTCGGVLGRSNDRSRRTR